MTHQPSTLILQPAVRLHIERLVLDGLPPGAIDHVLFQKGLEQELAHLLGQTLAADWTAQALARLDAQPATLAGNSGSAAWGRQIARTLMTALAPQPTQRTDPIASVNGSRQIG